MQRDKDAQWQRLIDCLLGYQATWIADIGLKTGLFRAIADAAPHGIGEDELAEALDFAPRYVRVWCRAAYAFEFIDWEEASGYRMAPHMEALLLDNDDPQFLGGRFQFYAALHEDFRAFPEHLATGETWPRSAHDPWLLEALKHTTEPEPVNITETVLPQASDTLRRLERGGTILDLGAGAGFALVHYARRFPNARVVGIEYDAPSAALARQALAEAGLDGRVELRCEDANDLADEAAYDLVTLNVALHEMGGPSAYRNVLRRVRRALKPGGTLVVSELPYPDARTAYRADPMYKMLAGVQVHEALVGCGMITQEQLRRLLEESGFAHVRVADQPLATRFVMLAEREAL